MINIIDELNKRFGTISTSEGADKCLICSRRHTLECPNSSKCLSLENKPYFKEEKKNNEYEIMG